MNYKLPGQFTKIAHWVNAIAIGVLVATGFMLMGDSDEGPRALRQIGFAWHIPFAAVFATGGLLYALALVVTGRWRMFALSGETVKSAVVSVRDTLRGKQPAHEPGPYNGAQILAYGAVLLMALGEVVSGFALYLSHRFPAFIATLGGRGAVREVHEALMFGILIFAVMHVIQVLRAGMPVIESMLLNSFNAPAPKERFAQGAVATATIASVAALAIAFAGTWVMGPLRGAPGASAEQAGAAEQTDAGEQAGDKP